MFMERRADMKNKELKWRLTEMQRVARDACKFRTSAREFLVKVGIVTKSGKLAKPYR